MPNHVTCEIVPSLPPKVSGSCRELFQIYGKIKYISQFHNKPCTKILICWWGEQESDSLNSLIDENNSFQFVYQIKTSRNLLESYFKSCGDIGIVLSSRNVEIASSKLKTKEISLDKVVPRICTLVNPKYRVIAKIKLHFKMLEVCSRVVEYMGNGNPGNPIGKNSFMLRVDYLKIRQAYNFASLVTTDFRVFVQVGGVEFECKSRKLCDDSKEIFFTNDFIKQIVSINDVIHFKVMWRRFGYLEKNILGECSVKVVTAKKRTIPILSENMVHIADLFIVFGSASQDSGDFSLSESNSPRDNGSDHLLLTNEDCSKEDQCNDSNGNDERLNLFSNEEEVKEDDNEDLYGLFYVGRLESSIGNSSYILTFKTFWSDESISTRFPVDNNFNFLHEFHVTTSQTFLEKVKNNTFTVDILKRTQELFGRVKLPLQQYYVAFRDQAIINHLKKSKHPVISMDGFAPIMTVASETVGKLQTTLAIGTKEQIDYLKVTKNIGRPTDPLGALLERLKNQMQLRAPAPLQPEETNSNSKLSKYFQFNLEIDSAFNLPKNPAWKKGLKKTSINYKMRQSRYPPNEEPFAYVTFQAEEGYGSMVKSHEGMVYSSKIAGQSSNPIWNQRFQVVLANDYINVDQKRFIMKVWKKAAITQELNTNMQPCPMEDAIIGFSAIDLSPFRRNANITGGVYNIVDFNGRINGQIKISANNCKPFLHDNSCGSVEDVSLSRAMKRKFTELEEISERLRARLFDVTGEANPDVDLKEIDDEEVDEFERDLNTECADDDGYEHGEGEFDWLARTPSDFNTGRMCPKEEKIKLISEFLKSNNGGDIDPKE